MKQEAYQVHVSDKLGFISCELITPTKPTALLVLGHGAGAGMHHSFMVQLAHALSEQLIATVRYQFPYMENGKKRPDPPAVAHKTIETVVDDISSRVPDTLLFAGGKSFGGRMTSQYAAKSKDTRLIGLVFYGFPLHPPGKPSTERAEHLKEVGCPMLFLQGTRDKLATPELMQEVTSRLKDVKLVNYDGADHSFHMLKSSGISNEEMIQKLAKQTSEWITELQS